MQRGLDYQAYYCEENIWRLCQRAPFAQEACEVAVITNPTRSCAVWSQRAAAGAGEPVVWDYHVVLARPVEGAWEVWDLDSTLGAPVSAGRWVEASFPRRVGARYAPRFRVLEAAAYWAGFWSDRSHMRLPDGTYQQPPPPWDAPLPEGRALPLSRLLDLRDPVGGVVLGLEGLRARWGAA
jgi:hypothetical protein